MPTVFCIAGPQGDETTSLLHGLAAELAGRGLQVGLIAREAAAPSAPPPGAQMELRVGPGSLCLAQAQLRAPSLEEMLARHAHSLDVVLSELHQDRKVFKIEYCPPGAAPTLAGDPNLKALVGVQPQDQALPCFAPQDLAGLAGLLTGLLPQPARPLLKVLVDGRRLPAKDFVQDIVASTIRALIGALKGGQGAKRVEIHLY
jgi:molybdopterin-guanine dinucleotide biosynthesis adapter protein